MLIKYYKTHKKIFQFNSKMSTYLTKQQLPENLLSKLVIVTNIDSVKTYMLMLKNTNI